MLLVALATSCASRGASVPDGGGLSFDEWMQYQGAVDQQVVLVPRSDDAAAPLTIKVFDIEAETWKEHVAPEGARGRPHKAGAFLVWRVGRDLVLFNPRNAEQHDVPMPDWAASRSKLSEVASVLLFARADDDDRLTRFDRSGYFDPATKSFVPFASELAPAPRADAQLFWTKRGFIVWGGEKRATHSDPKVVYTDGAIFDPAARAWRPIGAEGGPSPRTHSRAAVHRGELLVWSGMSESKAVFSGAIYNFDDDAWRPMSTVGAPSAISTHHYVANGRWLHWAGDKKSKIYDIRADRWIDVARLGVKNAYGARLLFDPRGQFFVAVDQPSNDPPRTLFRLDLEDASWTDLGQCFPFGHFRLTVWTGRYFFVWGETVVIASGGCENPPPNMGCDPASITEREPHGFVWSP